jgi:hypothetical protein
MNTQLANELLSLMHSGKTYKQAKYLLRLSSPLVWRWRQEDSDFDREICAIMDHSSPSVMPEEWFRFDKQMNIKGSIFDDNIPAWLRITEEYGRGYRAVEIELDKWKGMNDALQYSDDTMNWGHCVFTPDEVRSIRSSELSTKELAKINGVTAETIRNMKKRKTYKTIA